VSQVVELRPERRDELLAEAVAGSVPVVLTCRRADGWLRLRAWFLDIDVQAGQLVLEYPTAAGPPASEWEAQQEVGASFRRGHRKYVFGATVSGAHAAPGGRTDRSAHLRLQWPTTMQELQRRLYCRTPVPRGITIPVDLLLSPDHQWGRAGVTPNRATLLDISLGGLSLALLGDRNPGWRTGQRLTCRFPVEPDGPPVEIPAICRRSERLPDGRNRIGLQFLGLGTAAQDQATPQRLHRLAARLQRSQGRRPT